MKSIIEEASSISKAIEKGWTRAGKPKNFSIKVYEEPEKNFFGLTTKSAKIAIIFDEKTVTVPAPEKTNAQSAQTHHRSENRRPQHQRQTPSQTPQAHSKQKDGRKKGTLHHENASAAPHQNSEVHEISDDIKSAITAWLAQALPIMQVPESPFTLESSGQMVKIIFENQLIAEDQQEKTFLKSLSYLTLAMLRNKFKKGLRGVKLVFVRKHG